MTETPCIKGGKDVSCVPDDRCWDCELGPKDAKLKHELNVLFGMIETAIENKTEFLLMCAITQNDKKSATVGTLCDGEHGWELSRLVSTHAHDKMIEFDHAAIKKMQKEFEVKT